MTDAFVFDGIRTPFGRHGGSLARMRADDMMAAPIRFLLDRHPSIGDAIEDVIVGDSNQSGEDSRNVGRNAALLAGLPPQVAGATVNRLCGSGLAAAVDAARAVRCGEGDLFIAGGVECMSRAPFVVAKTETPFDRSTTMVDSTIGWRFPNDRLSALIGTDSLVETAQNLAEQYKIARDESDRFALGSQERYEAARRTGFYEDEIMPVTVTAAGRNPASHVVNVDEHPRPDTNFEKLTALRPITPDGTVTAGNATGINDGAVALLIGNEDAAHRFRMKPMARVVSSAVVGVEPRVMGIGPVPASRRALERANLTLDDIDLIEINEAFAIQVLACCKALGLAFDESRLNPNGGAIAIGHPLGASGARLLLTATRELHRRNGRYALVTLCVGIGQGIATIIERVD